MNLRLICRHSRPLAALAALFAAAAAALTARSDGRDRDALVSRAAELGLRGDSFVEAAGAVRRESDPGERRLALARALFVSRASAGSRGPDQRATRLEAAEALAIEALADLPASWEASSLLGSSRFESRRLRHDTRLFSASSDWERPLFAAVARASGSPIVERQLATAYVEVWPAMVPERRDQAKTLLRRMFRDRRFFLQHYRRWVEINRSIERAAELLPEDTETARRLLELAIYHGNARDIVDWAWEARTRLERELKGSIDHARVAGAAWSRAYLESVVERAPLGLDFAPLVERALAGASPEGWGLGFTEAAARWLLWAEPLCLVRECPLDPSTVSALLTSGAALVGSPSAAFARLAAGRPNSADQLASRAEAAWSEDWAAYVLLRAKRQLAAGDFVAARAALADVHRQARRRPTYLRLAELAGMPPAAGAHTTESSLAQTTWSSADWRRDENSLELELGVNHAAQGIRVIFWRPVHKHFLLEVELNGRVGPLVWAAHGIERIEIPLDLEPGVHLLRFRGPFLPGIERIELD